jgi:DNA gyrase subunit A
MRLNRRQDAMVAVFPIGENDQIMIVTDTGMVIRTPVRDIGIKRRRTQGVMVFRVGDRERVVSVARLADMGDDEPVDEENGSDTPGGESGGEPPPAAPEG